MFIPGGRWVKIHNLYTSHNNDFYNENTMIKAIFNGSREILFIFRVKVEKVATSHQHDT